MLIRSAVRKSTNTRYLQQEDVVFVLRAQVQLLIEEAKKASTLLGKASLLATADYFRRFADNIERM